VGATADLHFSILLSYLELTYQSTVLFSRVNKALLKILVSWNLGVDVKISNAEEANGIEKVFGTSPKASTPSQLLEDILKYLGPLSIYDCTIANPFILLDGHHSQLCNNFFSTLITQGISGTVALLYPILHQFGRSQMPSPWMDVIRWSCSITAN